MARLQEFRDILHKYSRLDYIKPSQIPDIDLYMDQVTTFMDERLSSFKRYPEDKTLTKTMINNYTKYNLLPPPTKKKYSKQHLLLMIYIYYMKNFLTIHDIGILLEPLRKKYFRSSGKPDLKDVYRETVHLETGIFRSFYKDVLRKIHYAEESFKDFPEEDHEYLQKFAFVSMLAFDVYLKKQLMESIIDGMQEKHQASQTKSPQKKSGESESGSK